MGKRRNTAKTGDKGIKKWASQKSGRSFKDDDDDPVYDEVDKFEQERDKQFISFESPNNSDDDESDQEEAVMDLAAGGDSSDDDDDDDSEEENDAKDIRKENEDTESDSSADEIDGVSSSDESMEEEDDVRAWGKKKSVFHGGDTADLELGQDEDDAYVEEAAAKEVQAARFKSMSEDDFVLSDAESDEKDDLQTKEELIQKSRDIRKLSLKEKRKVIDKSHPEMLPLLSHFSDVVSDLEKNTFVATKAMYYGEEGTADTVGATKLGQQYLLTKTLLQSSSALNLAMYLLLKSNLSSSEDADASVIQSHPVMSRLQQINSMIQKLEDGVENKVDGLKQQFSNLVKAAALMTSGDISESDNEENDNEDSDSDSAQEEKSGAGNESLQKNASIESASSASSSDEEASDLDEAAVEKAASRSVLTEARFGLRPNEIEDGKQNKRKRRRPILLDAGDDEEEIEEARQKSAMQSLAKTVNAIEQRSNTRIRRAAPLPEHLDNEQEEDGELRRGLDMMEAELGKLSDEEDGAGGLENDDYDDEDDGDVDNDNDFYSKVAKKSKAKKQARKDRYRVEPKFPRMEPEVDGERAINKQILKNRGLVAHKAKINRNPRVKKREQYRKALIRRKGAVREIRQDEAHKYGGEETGIKSHLSRSRKLIS